MFKAKIFLLEEARMKMFYMYAMKSNRYNYKCHALVIDYSPIKSGFEAFFNEIPWISDETSVTLNCSTNFRPRREN